MEKRGIKSNMRCIETQPDNEQSSNRTLIKSNMRCIETSIYQGQDWGWYPIKSNMRCIETLERFIQRRIQEYDKE